MNLTAYMTGGLGLAVALLYGLYAYEARKVEKRETIIRAHEAVQALTAKQLEDAAAVNDSNQKAISELMQDIAVQQKLTAKAERAARERDASLKHALKRIADAPQSDDGNIAPVLKRELDSLRADRVAQPGSADSTDQGATGVEPVTDRPDVPTAPPSS